MPRANNCTALVLYIDPMEFLSVEMKKVVELHSKMQILTCDYCNEQNPDTFYNACPQHKACSNCHDKSGFICNRHTGVCRVKGCKHTVAEFPLQPDERLSTSNKIHNEITEAMKTAVQFDHEEFRGKEQELSIAKGIATAEKARADKVTLDLEAARLELEEAQAATPAAPPRGRGTKRTLTDEEKEENREKRNLAKQRKLDREHKEKINAENAELVAILVPEMVAMIGSQNEYDTWLATKKAAAAAAAAAAAGPSSDDEEMDEDEDEC